MYIYLYMYTYKNTCHKWFDESAILEFYKNADIYDKIKNNLILY